ncbi:MAG: tetratricopeptide repeat protein, partial [Calditrichales bacterium]
MSISRNKNIRINYYGLSDVGIVRSDNQDSFGQFPGGVLDSSESRGLLFIVADGMGGHANGKEASSMAVQITSDEYYIAPPGEDVAKSLSHAVQSANAAVFQKSSGPSDGGQMGSTLSALVLHSDIAHIAHVGDSRIYRIRDNKLLQLTTDHTKVEELKRAGILNTEDAKNHPEKSVLNRALGVKEKVLIDLISDIILRKDDIFILCTDGLAAVTKEELIKIAVSETPRDACQKLIALANERGGADNSTVQVLKIESEPQVKTAKKRTDTPILRPLLLSMTFLLFLFSMVTIYIAFDYRKAVSRTIQTVTSEDRQNDSEQQSLYNRAQRYFEQNRYEEAIQAYQKLLIINPLDEDVIKALNNIAARFKIEGEKYE